MTPGKLWHYTFPGSTHLGAILAEGRIRCTDSNVHRYESSPPVVWLTTVGWGPMRRQDWMNGKVFARIEIDPREAVRWSEWIADKGMKDDWRERIVSSGGSDTWYVCERPIEKADFVAVEFAPTLPPNCPSSLAGRRIEDHDLSRLLRSARARQELELPATTRHQITGRRDSAG